MRSFFSDTQKSGQKPDEMKFARFEDFQKISSELDLTTSEIQSLQTRLAEKERELAQLKQSSALDSECLQMEINTLKEELREKTVSYEALQKKHQEKSKKCRTLSGQIKDMEIALELEKKEHEKTKLSLQQKKEPTIEDDESGVLESPEIEFPEIEVALPNRTYAS